jgi:hypothetical protein
MRCLPTPAHATFYWTALPVIKVNQFAYAGTSNAETESDIRFTKLDRWTFLLMQVFEGKAFLDLAERIHIVHPQSSPDDVLTQQALFRSFLLAYGKCFLPSGQGRSSLDANKVFKDDPRSHFIHERIIELRNRFAAHNDTSGLDHSLIRVEELEDQFRITQNYSVGNPLDEYDNYREALRVVESYVLTQTSKTITHLEKTLHKRISVRREA